MHPVGNRQTASRIFRALAPAMFVLFCVVGCAEQKPDPRIDQLRNLVFMLSMALAGSVVLIIVFFLVGTAFGSAARRDAERTGGSSRRQSDGR